METFSFCHSECAFPSSTHNGLDVHSSVLHRTIHQNSTILALSCHHSPYITIGEYQIGQKRFRVESPNGGEKVLENMTCGRSPKHSSQVDYKDYLIFQNLQI